MPGQAQAGRLAGRRQLAEVVARPHPEPHLAIRLQSGVLRRVKHPGPLQLRVPGIVAGIVVVRPGGCRGRTVPAVADLVGRHRSHRFGAAVPGQHRVAEPVARRQGHAGDLRRRGLGEGPHGQRPAPGEGAVADLDRSRQFVPARRRRFQAQQRVGAGGRTVEVPADGVDRPGRPHPELVRDARVDVDRGASGQEFGPGPSLGVDPDRPVAQPAAAVLVLDPCRKEFAAQPARKEAVALASGFRLLAPLPADPPVAAGRRSDAEIEERVQGQLDVRGRGGVEGAGVGGRIGGRGRVGRIIAAGPDQAERQAAGGEGRGAEDAGPGLHDPELSHSAPCRQTAHRDKAGRHPRGHRPALAWIDPDLSAAAAPVPASRGRRPGPVGPPGRADPAPPARSVRPAPGRTARRRWPGCGAARPSVRW